MRKNLQSLTTKELRQLLDVAEGDYLKAVETELSIRYDEERADEVVKMLTGYGND